MATVTLDRLWVHDADDPASYIKLRLEAAQDESTRSDEVVVSLTGRRRHVRTPQNSRVVDYKCSLVARQDAEQLEDWAGQLLLFRDPRGRKFYGVTNDVETVEVPGVGTGLVDLSFSVEEVDHDEAV